jgi:YVTN family beta-propeller protein
MSKLTFTDTIVRRAGFATATLLVTALLGCSSGAEAPLTDTQSLTAALTSGKPQTAGKYTLFEAGPVRPIAVLADGLVAVTNVPDDRVELFRVGRGDVTPCGSVKVGLRPVALAAVADRLWVVNHLSDSVSVLDVDTKHCSARIERTLQVGDEPRDIVTAPGRNGQRYVFVTAAHRGQNVQAPDGSSRDPALTEPGLGRADVFVFDAAHLGSVNAEKPIEILSLFTDTPRALAVGQGKVFAAGFMSGNQTSIVRYQLVAERGRESLRRLDTDGDLKIDASLPADQRIVEGGYPALHGHGRCLSGKLSSPVGGGRTDFLMDVCVRTDPSQPNRALEIVPQHAGTVSPECSCTDSIGELQMSPPLIVRFYDSAEVCGENFDPARGGCWLEPPQTDVPVSGPNTPKPLRVQAWNQQVALSLPDRDVFTIDPSQTPPALVSGGDFQHVGTTLFNMAVHPKTGKIFVSNTEARNLMRFEGPGAGSGQSQGFASTTVRGHIAENRISVLTPANHSVKPVHLNGHIDFSQCCQPTPNAESERSLAFPVGLAITSKRTRSGQLLDAQELYVAALGSDKVAVLDTQSLESAGESGLQGDRRAQIEVAGGPVGLTLDEERERLYVLAHFSNELVVIDTNSRRVVGRHAMFSPEPEQVKLGRPFLYDARHTSSHGDSACASCHVFGDFDGLSWDLGAPDDRSFPNTGPVFARPEFTSAPLTSDFLAVKGPMATQSLRGLANHGAMHWRGDRRGGKDSTVHAQPDTGAYDEQAAFTAFNVAFPGLNGRSAQLPAADMQKFTNFALALSYPPNPIRHLDDQLTPAQARARSRYFGCEITNESMAQRKCADGRDIDEETLNCNCLNPPEFVLGLVKRPDYCPANPRCTLDVSDFQNTCNGCHTLDARGNSAFGVDKPGFFGTDGRSTNDSVSHMLKIPHLRNMYQKVGMFGSVQTRQGVGLNNLADSIFGPRQGGLLSAQNAFLGDQVRGFGFTHAGEEDTVFHFFSASGFSRAPAPGGPLINDNRAGFDAVLPHDPRACFGDQLQPLNRTFSSQLATPEVLQQLKEQLGVLSRPDATPEQKAAASQVLASFLSSLPASNPGAVFQRLPLQSALAQLALPLLACPSLPPYATLQSLGCFELKTGAACAQLIASVRGCALWGATLERIVPNGTQVCDAGGLSDKADMESFVFSFESNLKPIVGQQLTWTGGGGSSERQRLDLLISQATSGNSDLVVDANGRGFVFTSGQFLRDDGTWFSLTRLLNRTTSPLTFTSVPPGEGRRIGVDRDSDGILDARDQDSEVCATDD